MKANIAVLQGMLCMQDWAKVLAFSLKQVGVFVFVNIFKKIKKCWRSGLAYLPVYNARPCIICTPILGVYFQQKKKGRQKNSRSGYEKIKTSWFGNTLETTLDHLFRNVAQCAGHETISSSDGLFWQSAFVKSWILSAVNSIQLLDYSRNTMVRELGSICEELELNWSFLLRILLSHFLVTWSSKMS